MATKLILPLLLCFSVISPLFSQTTTIQQPLSINTSGAAPDASAMLDVNATDKGMLVPRMTSAQRTAIASPATSLLVFDTDTGAFWFYGGTAWSEISPQSALADADGDTKIQVEESPDEDIIRFDLAGTEQMVLRKNAFGLPRLELTNSNSNVFIGESAGSNVNTTNCVAIGTGALSFCTKEFNVAVGDSALHHNLGGAHWASASNTALGSKALFNNTYGAVNTACGAFALLSNTYGLGNTANGAGVLYSNTTGNGNTASGSNALSSNTTGGYNTASGTIALYSNTTGGYNTASGTNALYHNTTGGYNTAIGDRALSSYTTGNNNTALGANADVSVNNLTNATAIGNGTTVNASDKVRIGNAAVTVIEGQVAWTFPSDARFKFNVRDDAVPGLAFIEKLRPVTYQFDTRKFDEHLMQNMPDSVQQRRMAGLDYSKSSATVQTGFLAQEVERACKDLNFTFSGLHVPESKVDNYGLAYGSFVPLLVKGIQEQQVIIETQKVEIEALKSQLDNLSRELGKITAALAGAGISVEK